MTVAQEFRIVSPGGSLGYGVNADSLARAVDLGLDAIGADAGSTDFGAYYLGSGEAYHSRYAVRRDVELVLATARKAQVPLLIGNAGGAGADVHVEWMRTIVREAATDLGMQLKLAVIRAEQDPEYLRERVRAGKVEPMLGAAELTEEVLDRCVRLVAQMGAEPFITALDNGADVVIAGRACDSGIFAAAPVRSGYDAGMALHMGKILECGALSAVPPTGRDCLVGAIRATEFEIAVPNPERIVTPYSAAAHMVYEVENPYTQGEPTGLLDFTDVELIATSPESTTVRGTLFHKHPAPTLRFEGAEHVGFRSFVVGGIRDPYLIETLDEYIDGCSAQVRELVREGETFELDWIVYGRDGVMGAMEARRAHPGHEVGLVVQVLAPRQETAHDVAALLEARMIGFAYSGAKTRTAHVAFPFSPLVNDTGAVYRFGVLHIAELRDAEDLTKLFPIDYEIVG